MSFVTDVMVGNDDNECERLGSAAMGGDGEEGTLIDCMFFASLAEREVEDSWVLVERSDAGAIYTRKREMRRAEAGQWHGHGRFSTRGLK